MVRGPEVLGRDVYIALLHYPVLDKSGRLITTAVTNMDLHDMARLARTYGLKGFFVVQPLELQKKLVNRLTGYWGSGRGGEYNPTRQEAFSLVRLADDLDGAIERIERETGKPPAVIGTSARKQEGAIGAADLIRTALPDVPWLVVFGTGWGIDPAFLAERTDYVLEPIMGSSDYNHLSVRTAAAIILDRLLGGRGTDTI